MILFKNLQTMIHVYCRKKKLNCSNSAEKLYQYIILINLVFREARDQNLNLCEKHLILITCNITKITAMKLTLTDSVISELHPRLNETRNETKIFAFGAKLERVSPTDTGI